VDAFFDAWTGRSAWRLFFVLTLVLRLGDGVSPYARSLRGSEIGSRGLRSRFSIQAAVSLLTGRSSGNCACYCALSLANGRAARRRAVMSAAFQACDFGDTHAVLDAWPPIAFVAP